jgi:pyruvate/2-oxoglutarate dehydrogenase complex dihydrolipoamide acyltransferase (E2) component
MLIRRFLIPRELGEAIEVRLLLWCKTEGQQLGVGDALLEFETDKALVLVAAAQPAVLRRCFFREGEWMKPGDTVAWLSDDAGEPLPGEADTPAEELLVDFNVT